MSSRAQATPYELQGDRARQAIHALRGYAYQIYASAIAWLELRDQMVLHLEIAEDFAITTRAAITAVQVSDAPSAGPMSLGSQKVRSLLDSFVRLSEANPARVVCCRLLATAPVGVEQDAALRAHADGSLTYWRHAAAGADVAPLRAALANANLAQETLQFFAGLDDTAFRNRVLRQIHWDCGQPPLDGVRYDFEQQLIPFGWDHAHLPPSEASQLSGPIVEQLLIACTTPGDRELTRADLLALVEKHGRISLSREDVEQLLAAKATSFAAARKLIPDHEVGLPPILVARAAFTRDLVASVERDGIAFVAGGSGTGKTIAARLAARAINANWSILDLRDLDASATVARLLDAQAELASPTLRGVVIDDLNQLDDPIVARAFARFMHALRRRDLLAFVTLYNRPGVRALGEMAVTTQAFVEVPGLSLDEVREMIATGGGDPDLWAPIIVRRSDGGHPQLVQAMVLGLTARGWPATEIAEWSRPGGGSPDVRDERTSARARLVASVPERSRTLLYRLSLAIGRFSRDTALTIGRLDPALDRPGEALDPLIGPWIDRTSGEEFHVSPLIYKAGNEILGADERRSVHAALANAITDADQVAVDQVSAAYVHGIAGRAEDALNKIAFGIVAAKPDEQRKLAGYLVSLRLTRTSQPIVPTNRDLSGMLRLAQMIVSLPSASDDEIAKIWEALWREKDAVELGGSTRRFEAMVLVKMLLSERACRAIPDWFEHLLRLDALGQIDPDIAALVSELETSGRLRSAPTVLGMLFMAQAGRLPTVAALVALMERIDKVEPGLRDRLLAEYRNVPSEFALLINNAWAHQHQEGTIDATAASEGFRRIVELALSWGYPTLAVRAEIAVAIMQDEYGGDSDAALKTLTLGETRFGHSDAFARAVAKVLYRRSDYAGALAAMEALAPDFASADPIERAFQCREAGVCAAHLGRWQQAHDWFAKGRVAADQVPSELFKPMAIGLSGDAAYATYRRGDLKGAFEALAVVAREVESLLPLKTLRAAHCYKVFGHLVLSINNDASHDFDGMIEGLDLLPPGACSNPEPNPGIEGLPQAPIDSLWYLLADAANRFHIDVGIDAALEERIGTQRLINMEHRLREGRLTAAISSQSFPAFCQHLRSWVDHRVYLPTRYAEIRRRTLEDPLYEPVPVATAEQLASEVARDAAEEALFPYLAIGILAGDPTAWREVGANWAAAMQPGYPGTEFLELVANPGLDTSNPRLTVARALGHIAAGTPLAVEDVFTATLRMVEKAGRLPIFKREIAASLDQWAVARWKQIVAEQRFALKTPAITVPPLEQAIARAPGLGRVAAIALAAAPAIGASLPADFRAVLAQID